MFKKAAVVAVLAVAAIFTVPLAATAAGYVPDGNVIVSDPTPEPNQSTIVTFTDGSFTPFENVIGSAKGDPTPTIAIVKMGTASATKPASSTGSVSFTVTASRAGTYQVTGVGATSGNIGVATFTVVQADSSAGLPNTGSEFPILTVWIGAGALALGVALVLVIASSRRRSKNA